MSAGAHIFWITSRAAGIAALALSSLAVTIGLLMSSRRTAGRRVERRALHEALSLATLAAIAVHGAALLFDSWLRPGLAGIAIPFAGGYRPLWTGIGIISGYGLAVLGLSYYFRDRIGQRRWRTIHQLTSVVWVLGVAHTLGSGTDAHQTWFLVVMAAPVLCAGGLVMLRAGREIAAMLDLPRSSPPMDLGAGHRLPSPDRAP